VASEDFGLPIGRLFGGFTPSKLRTNSSSNGSGASAPTGGPQPDLRDWPEVRSRRSSPFRPTRASRWMPDLKR